MDTIAAFMRKKIHIKITNDPLTGKPSFFGQKNEKFIFAVLRQ